MMTVVVYLIELILCGDVATDPFGRRTMSFDAANFTFDPNGK